MFKPYLAISFITYIKRTVVYSISSYFDYQIIIFYLLIIIFFVLFCSGLDCYLGCTVTPVIIAQSPHQFPWRTIFQKKKKKKVIWAHWRFTLQISALFECHHGGQRWPRTPPEIDSDVRGVGLAGVPLSAEGSLELRSPSTSAGLKDKVQGQSGRRVRWCMGLLIVCF